MTYTLVFPARPVLRFLGEGQWQLTHDYAIPLNGHDLTVPEGFVTDLASVPAWLRGLIDDSGLGGASVIAHDWLYQHGGWWAHTAPQWPRRQVDAVFRRLMRLEGVPAVRRTVAWLAVRLAGWACWRRSNRKEPLVDYVKAIVGPAVGLGVAAFLAVFPSAALVTDLSAARAAVEAGVAAAIGGALGALYVLSAGVWGRVGNWLRRHKPA